MEPRMVGLSEEAKKKIYSTASGQIDLENFTTSFGQAAQQ